MAGDSISSKEKVRRTREGEKDSESRCGSFVGGGFKSTGETNFRQKRLI